MQPTTFKASLAMALDCALLFERATGHTPDVWQAQLLRSTERRVLLNCARQSGKSTVVASIALHSALYNAGALVLALSPSLRQSQELFRKVQHQYRALGRPVAAVSETTTHLELGNGSRVVCLPESEETIRGYSAVALLVIDEASRVADAVIDATLPMLAVSGGRLLCLSTPWGRQGFFWQTWTQGGERWQRFKVTALDCPRITPDVLAEARTRGEWFYQQEWMGEFGEREDSVFDFALVQRAVTPAITAYNGALPAVDDW